MGWVTEEGMGVDTAHLPGRYLAGWLTSLRHGLN